MDSELEIKVSFQDEVVEEVVSVLKKVGAKDIEQIKKLGMAGIDDVVLCVVVIYALTDFIFKLSNLWKCGVVVDARRKRILTEKNCDLPRGTVLVISPDGTKSKLFKPSKFQISELFQSCLK